MGFNQFVSIYEVLSENSFSVKFSSLLWLLQIFGFWSLRFILARFEQKWLVKVGRKWELDRA